MKELPIENYDTKEVQIILDELHRLDRGELFKIEAHEKRNHNRGEVLEAIQAELRGPIENYNDLSGEEIIEKLEDYCRKDLEAIMNYERHRDNRKEILTAIHEKMPVVGC